MELDRFLADLCNEIARAYGCPDGIKTKVESVAVPPDLAVPLALIVNELITNVIKHVGPPCEITVEAGSGSELRLKVSDSGSGPPLEVVSQGLGGRIIEALSKQLDAKLDMKRESSGYAVELTVPLPTSY